MKIKKEYYILTGLVILLSLYLVFHSSGKINYSIPVVKTIKSSTISHITITSGKQSIRLNKGKYRWRIAPDNYRVDKTLMDSLLANLTSIDLVDMVSRSGSYEPYGLAKDKGIHVVAEDSNGKILRDIVIGSQTTGGNFTYIKLDNDKNVYTIKGRVRNHFETTAQSLMDKKVLSFVPGDIQKISIKKEGKDITFIKEKNDKSFIWKTSNGKKVDTKKITDYLDQLSRLNFTAYTKATPSSAVVTITLSDKKGLHSLTLSGKTGKGYPGTSSYTEKAFVIDGGTGDLIMKNIDGLEKELYTK